MSGWNYRIVRHTQKVENGDESWKNVSYSIHEAFYTTDGYVGSITSDPICICGDDISELRDCYASVIEAFSRPVLDYDNIPEPGYTEENDPMALAMKEIPVAIEKIKAEDWKGEDGESILWGTKNPEFKKYLAEQHKERQLQEYIHINNFVGMEHTKVIEEVFLKDDDNDRHA